jgi:hypothetical protein
VRIFVGGFAGAGVLVLVWVAASRKVALRVDASGVTLGGRPFHYAATTVYVPWSDVDAIVLWYQQVSTHSMLYIGIQRRPGASAPRGSRRRNSLLGSVVPHVPVDVVRASRPLVSWYLDREELASAVDRFSPGTPIRDEWPPARPSSRR